MRIHTTIFLLSTLFLVAQKQPQRFNSSKKAEINFSKPIEDFYVDLQCVEKPIPGGIPNIKSNSSEKKKSDNPTINQSTTLQRRSYQVPGLVGGIQSGRPWKQESFVVLQALIFEVGHEGNSDARSWWYQSQAGELREGSGIGKDAIWEKTSYYAAFGSFAGKNGTGRIR